MEACGQMPGEGSSDCRGGKSGWPRLWDAALDLGWKAVKELQMLRRAMSHHGRGS